MDKKRFRVLVVDDDELLCDLATTMLGGEYDVDQAYDGLDALEKARACPPDLVITDLMMPRMHGYELCERLKKTEGAKPPCIIVVSAKSFATDIAQARAAGADDYLVKPLDMKELLSKAKEMLSGKCGAPAITAPAPAAPVPAEAPALPKPAPEDRLPVSVRFWGTRGSSPVSGAASLRYGGNTPCVEVRAGEMVLIIDCGTGLRELGLAMLKEFKGRPLNAHILVGHTHWDHIQGFPFFAPLYNPRNSFSVYSVHGAHASLQSVLSGTMSSDYFPIPLSSLAARLRFVEMSGTVSLGPVDLSYKHLNHPGVCIGFRLEIQGRSITYLSDHEGYAKLNGDSELSRRQDAEVVEFARNSDLLIREAQYTEEEYLPRRGWGHGTFDDAVRDGAAAGVKRLALTHHDPDHSDDFLDAQMERCRALAGGKFDCFAARDGLALEL
jgi:phosphoribosyl 1,2-cyclic phosphodiesterase/DNA-binding NarL/FixJ family response regulator